MESLDVSGVWKLDELLLSPRRSDSQRDASQSETRSEAQLEAPPEAPPEAQSEARSEAQLEALLDASEALRGSEAVDTSDAEALEGLGAWGNLDSLLLSSVEWVA